MATQAFVAVGGGKLSVSSDTQVWVERDVSARFSGPENVVWSKPVGRFAVLAAGSTTSWSSDSTSWAPWSATTMNNVGLAWSTRLGKFVAVGHDAVNTSADGGLWVDAPGVGSVLLVDVAATASGDGSVADVVVVGYTWGAVPRCFSGVFDNGSIVWTQRALPSLSGLPNSITWSAVSGYVIVTSEGEVVVSSTGGSWVLAAPVSGARWVGEGPSGTVIAVGGASMWQTLFPAQGWTPVVHGFGSVDFTGKPVLARGPNLVVVPTSEGVAVSPNLVAWSHNRVGHYVNAVAWSEIDNLAPDPPTVVAPVGGSIAQDRVNRFRWVFHDPNVGDKQTAFELRWQPVGGGWQPVISSVTPNEWVDVPGGTFTLGLCEWQVRTRDNELWGAWSDSQFFTAVLQPDVPSITSPVEGATIGAGTVGVEWSAPAQEAFQLRRVGDGDGSPDLGVVYWDSGVVVSSSLRLYPVDFPVNNRWEHVQVRVRQNGLWTGWDSVRVEVSYTPPVPGEVNTHVFTVGGSAAGLRYSVDIPEPGPGEPEVTHMDIWRRVEGDLGGGIRVARGLAPSGYHDDYAVASGVEYEVRARFYGANGTASWSEWNERVIGVLAVSEGGVLGLEGR